MIKKFFSVLLAAAVFLCGAVTVSAETAGTYIVKRDVVYVYEQPDALSPVCGEITKGLYVTVTETNGAFGRAFFASHGIYGWVELSGLTFVPEEDAKTDIVSIKVTPPEKTVYVHNEETLELDGMTVLAVTADGTQTPVKGYRVYADSFATTGEKTVTVAFRPQGTNALFTDSFTVSVIPLPVTAVIVDTPPEKTDYLEHETPDLTGLTVTVKFTDRPDERYTCNELTAENGFTVSANAFAPLEPGETEITVGYKYENVKTTFTLRAAEKVLTALSVVTPPENDRIYSKNAQPDLTGLTLLAEYDNGESRTVSAWECEVACDPQSFILGGGNPVTVSFGGRSVTLYYTLSLNGEKGIYIVTPTVITYRLGFDIDLTDLKIYTEYFDGTIVPLKDYTLGAIDKTLTGTQNVTVVSGGYSGVFSIYVTPYYGKGDVNGSGKTDVTDARLALRAAIGFTKLGGITLEAADIDLDGQVTVADARLILRQAIGLEDFAADAKVLLP